MSVSVAPAPQRSVAPARCGVPDWIVHGPGLCMAPGADMGTLDALVAGADFAV